MYVSGAATIIRGLKWYTSGTLRTVVSRQDQM